MNSYAYNLIVQYYSNKIAQRSKIPLIQHINEGIEILEELDADLLTIDAFCLHPIFQDDNALVDLYWSDKSKHLSIQSVILAVEYRNIANSYLSKHYRTATDRINLSAFYEVNLMLLADKLQNKKDFIIHAHLYDNASLLNNYFNNWINKLSRYDNRFSEYVAKYYNEHDI